MEPTSASFIQLHSVSLLDDHEHEPVSKPEVKWETWSLRQWDADDDPVWGFILLASVPETSGRGKKRRAR